MLLHRKTSFEPESPYLVWKLLSIIAIGAMLASIIGSVYFLYTTIYRVLDDAYTIVILEADVQLDTINTKLYQRAQELVTLKNDTTSLPQEITNVFVNRATTRTGP